MKKIISLLIPLCVAFAMVTAVSFASTDDPQQEPGSDIQVQQVEDQAVDPEAVPAKGAAKESTDPQLAAQDDPAQEGWVQDVTGWRYFSGGNYLTGKQELGGNYYFFEAENGYMQTGWQVMGDNHKNYFDPTPGQPGQSTYGTMKTGWLTLSGSKYYLEPGTGNMVTGWKTIGSDKYYFNNNGKMKTGWLTDGGKKYYFANNGKMKTGWLKLNNAKYYFSDKGVMFTGKHKINGAIYYFDDNTGKMKTGWVSDGGSKYYYNDNGKQHFGWLKLNGKKYYLNTKSGKMQTGRKKVSGSYYYFASNGVMAASKAIKLSGKLHYFFSSGKEVTGKGWFKGSDKKSRYATGGGTVATGKKTINGITYKFSTKTGVCVANLGDVYDQKIRNYSSNTSYLLYAIKAKFQVRVYKGSKGNWSRVHTFDCAFGNSSHPTGNGTYTVNSKTAHHNYGGGKYHWNNGLNYTGSSAKPGAGFNGYVWTGQYPDGSIYDSKLRAYCTGGRIRVAESNSVWLYNNIPVGTKVVVQ